MTEEELKAIEERNERVHAYEYSGDLTYEDIDRLLGEVRRLGALVKSEYERGLEDGHLECQTDCEIPANPDTAGEPQGNATP